MRNVFPFFFLLNFFASFLYGTISWTDFSSAIAATGTSPKVATDGSGKALAVWLEGTTVVKGAYFNGTSWGTAATLQSGAETLSQLELSMDSSENGIAAWRSTAGVGSVEVSIYDPAMDSWSSPVNAASGALVLSGVFFPRVSVDNAGRALVVFKANLDVPAGPFALCAGRQYTFATDTWAPSIGSDPELFSNSPNQATGGVAISSYESGGSMRNVILYSTDLQFSIFASLIEGGVLYDATQLASSSETSGPDVSVAANSSNFAIAIWPFVLPGNGEIRWSRLTDFETPNWTANARIVGSVDITASSPSIALDSSGNAHAVWVSGDGVNTRIQYAKYSSGSWGTVADISEESDADEPSVSLNSSGDVVVIWSQEGAILGRSNISDIWDPLLTDPPTTISAAGTSPSLAILSNETNPKVTGFDAMADDAFAVWEESGGIYGALGVEDTCPNFLYFLLGGVEDPRLIPESLTVQDLLDIYRNQN